MKTQTEQHRLTLSYSREIYYKLTILDANYSADQIAEGLEGGTLARDGHGDQYGEKGYIRINSRNADFDLDGRIVAEYSIDDDDYIEGDNWTANANWYDESDA